MKIVGSDLAVKILEENNVKYSFGVPGGHLLKFFDSIKESNITPILTKHESGASFMATGYAQVSGKLGVCIGTVGPGATNLVTGVASAYMDSVPILVITAQVGNSAIGKGGLQEATGQGRTVDHVEIFDGMTKYSTLVNNGIKLNQSFNNAIKLALNGRPGPVHLDITADTFASEIEVDEKAIKKISRMPMGGDPESIKKASELLAKAETPAILAGAGAHDAATQLKELVEKYKIPIATTLRAKGILPENHELSLGVVGLYGTNIANKYLRSEIDVLLAVGTSFSEFTTHTWDPKFQPKLALIQIDIDPWEIDKNYQSTICILGDSKLSLTQILSELKNYEPKTRNTESLIKEKIQRQYFADPAMSSESIPIKPQRMMKSLRDALPEDTIVFGDIGNNLAWVETYYQSLKPNTYYITSSLASMGYGVSASIGGQIAAADRQVVCICGDGGFQMQGMEVVTAVNYNVPVKWFIMNNSTLGMIKDTQNVIFKGRKFNTDFINPDYVKLAEAMGAVGLRAEKPDEIIDVTKQALENGRPTIVDVLIDADEAPSFDARAEAMTRAWGVQAGIWQKIKLIPEIIKRL
ncbi:thiamine pyrophosphate-binding protein [Candidatus Bathyarchaeota archaeon]|nr:MAG: thiamine pyrophosphate-binding protein [Candidatus Bathyarchaeota archaeon]